jgi:hypothetical protein
MTSAAEPATLAPLEPPATTAEPRDARSWDFLVSSAADDEDWAAWIAWHLELRGYRVHQETWDADGGDSGVLRLIDALANARRVVVVLSDAYLRSDAVQAEWQAAWQADPRAMRRKLVPVRVAECDAEGLLGDVPYIDLVGLSKADAEAEVKVIERTTRARPNFTPAFPGTPAVPGA